MPFVFYEDADMPDGAQAADVRTIEDYNSIVAERDAVQSRLDDAMSQVSSLEGERDTLAVQLDDAKKKFADAFLSSPAQAKRKNDEDLKSEDKPMTFGQLFAGRNDKHAN